MSEDDPDVTAALTQAARVAMDEMLACGLDQIAGGEVFAPDFVHTVPPRLDGVEAERLRDMERGQAGVARYRVTGAITAPRGLGHARGFRRERAIEPRLHKAAVPSPYTIGLSFPPGELDDNALDGLTEVVRAEIADLVAAGATEVQLDAPSEAIACATDALPVSQLAELLSRPFTGFDITRSVHFCLGDIARKPSTEIQNLRSLLPLIQALDGHIDRAHVECAYSGQWEERNLLGDVPESIDVVAGIANVKEAPASRDQYRSQIEQLLDVVPENRLLVSTSCGCGRVPHDDAIRLNLELVRAGRWLSGSCTRMYLSSKSSLRQSQGSSDDSPSTG